MFIIAWIFEALEGWGITKLFSSVSSYFRNTPQKDEDKVHEVENNIKDLSTADLDKRVQSIQRD